MAALTCTAANVAPSPGATRIAGHLAGVAITAGQTIYLDPATNTWKLGNSATALGAAIPQAIAGNTAGVGQVVDAIVKDDDFTHGLTGVVACDTLWQHPSNGAITLTAADNVSTNFVTLVGIAKSATKARINFLAAGVAK